MSQPSKPTSAETKPDAPTATSELSKGELAKGDLDKVTGGKVQVHDITITKQIDKSSPSLG
jgi:type VI protein secretion system component Hcp